TPQAMVDAGLVKRVTLPIKILGNGELKKPITVQAHKFSKSAEAKIQAAGGSIEVIPGVLAAPHQLPEYFQDSRAVDPLPVHAGDARRLPDWGAHPDARYQRRSAFGVFAKAGRGASRLSRYFFRWFAVAANDLCAGHHALYQRVDHFAAADGGGAASFEA